MRQKDLADNVTDYAIAEDPQTFQEDSKDSENCGKLEHKPILQSKRKQGS